MTDLHELTEEFKCWALSELEYREALKAWGYQPWWIDKIVDKEKLARFQSLKHDKDTVYS